MPVGGTDTDLVLGPCDGSETDDRCRTILIQLIDDFGKFLRLNLGKLKHPTAPTVCKEAVAVVAPVPLLIFWHQGIEEILNCLGRSTSPIGESIITELCRCLPCRVAGGNLGLDLLKITRMSIDPIADFTNNILRHHSFPFVARRSPALRTTFVLRRHTPSRLQKTSRSEEHTS